MFWNLEVTFCHSNSFEKPLVNANVKKKHLKTNDTDDTNYDWFTHHGPEMLSMRTGRVGNWGTNSDHKNFRITKIGQDN